MTSQKPVGFSSCFGGTIGILLAIVVVVVGINVAFCGGFR